MSKYRIAHDWSPAGVDKRDESMDGELAHDWLSAMHILNSEAADDVIDRVHEMIETNPGRGWRLTKTLVQLAQDDTEFFGIGRRVLPLMLKWHEHLYGAELAALVRSDPRYRRVLKNQISSYEKDFIDRHNLAPSLQDRAE